MEPFTVSIPDSALDKLFQKLSATIFPDELEEAGRGYGAPLTDIKRLTQYWRNSYDWRKHEEKINELPNYKTPIQVDGFGTLDIHFVHQKSEAEGAIPLLFCHGCKLQQTIYLQPPLSFVQGPVAFWKLPSFFPSLRLAATTHPPSTSSFHPSPISASPLVSKKKASASLNTPKPATNSCKSWATPIMVRPLPQPSIF